MRVGDRVRIKIRSEYTKEAYKVAKVFEGTATIVVDVTNNFYGIGWPGKIEIELAPELDPERLYWYSTSYIKVGSKKLVI